MATEKPKLKIISLCSGIGCQERGTENAGVFDVECVATSEIDIDAIVSYAAIHHGLTEDMIDNYDSYPPMAEMRAYLKDLNIGYSPEKNKEYVWTKSGKAFERKVKKVWLACMLNKNFGDISRVERLPKADLWFLSFPCTDLSISGKMLGMAEGSGTRSSLVWNTIRLLDVAKETKTLPDYMILENVKSLVSKKFIEDFNRLNNMIEEKFGYHVMWDIIDGKDTGVPQHRERVFAVYLRKEIYKGTFTFPKPFDTGIRMKDILEEKVDKKYYIDGERAQALIDKLIVEGKLPEYVEEEEE